MARAGLAVALALPAAASAACPPEGMDREGLQAFKVRRFETADPAQRQRLALALAGCLGDPDPAVRDGIAYQALAQWMRAGELDVATLRALRDRLHALVDGGEGEGFARPFAALVLSEVARTDRIAPWMTPGERKAMVRKAAGYVATVQDYRGFDDARGWRHGVAHGADWLLQLALHPALERDQGDLVLEAVAAQAVPGTAHAYVFGEPARLPPPGAGGVPPRPAAPRRSRARLRRRGVAGAAPRPGGVRACALRRGRPGSGTGRAQAAARGDARGGAIAGSRALNPAGTAVTLGLHCRWRMDRWRPDAIA
ncbi:DUF2785 domain-containing protein [Luteimonas sp. J16]|uniref:DUF2785 domain-containing protein n=1 Tax=Luteimonas sp. J16 TaxID=935283 RepID=UPI00119F2119|nr:DUF2785 domain-containing protein [Luteimonas sp. J16]